MLSGTHAVPSRKALRVLRHLALYGSLGTVTGTAVLLAEERRRRICIARKIVENGIKLKSSDRYIHISPTVTPSASEDLSSTVDASYRNDFLSALRTTGDVLLPPKRKEPRPIDRLSSPEASGPGHIRRLTHEKASPACDKPATIPPRPKTHVEVDMPTRQKNVFIRMQDIGVSLQWFLSANATNGDGLGSRGKGLKSSSFATAGVTLRLSVKANTTQIAHAELRWTKSEGNIRLAEPDAVIERCRMLMKYVKDQERWRVFARCSGLLSNLELPASESMPVRLDLLDLALGIGVVSGVQSSLPFVRACPPTDIETWIANLSARSNQLITQNRATDAAIILTAASVKDPDLLQTHEVITVLSYLFLDSGDDLQLDDQSFAHLFKACSVKKLWDLIIDVYEQHQKRTPFDPTVRAIVANAYASCLQIDEAIHMVRSMQTDGEIAAAIFEKGQVCYQLLLRRLWKETEQIDKVRNLFDDMRSWGPQAAGPKPIHVSVHNAMIAICTLAGDVTLAQQHIGTMLADADQKPDLHTFGYFMIALAASDQWSSVDALLLRQHQLGFTSGSSDSVPFFNVVLQHFVRTHDATQTQMFVSKAIETHGIVPNQYTLNRVLDALVSEGRLDRIAPWIKYLHHQGFELGMDASSVFFMFRRFFLVYRPGHLLLMKLARLLNAWTQSLVSKELYGVIIDGIGYELRKTQPDRFSKKVGPAEVHLRTVEKWRDSVPSLSEMGFAATLKPKLLLTREPRKSDEITPGDTLRKLITALSFDRPAEAVRMYKEALAAKLPESDIALEVAVEASIRDKWGSFAESQALLRLGTASAANVVRAKAPITFHGIQQGLFADDDDLYTVVRRFYRVMEESHIPVKHFIASAAAHQLVMGDKPADAIKLLTEVMRSRTGEHERVDIGTMSILARAYAAVGDLDGFCGVVDTALDQKLRIDDVFIRTLRSARKKFMKRLGSGADSLSRETTTQRFERLIKDSTSLREHQKRSTDRIGKDLIMLCKRLADRPPKVRRRLEPPPDSVFRVYKWPKEQEPAIYKITRYETRLDQPLGSFHISYYYPRSLIKRRPQSG